MHHLYIKLHKNTLALQKEREELELWCRSNDVTDYNCIEDGLVGRVDESRIDEMLRPIGAGDVVVAEDLSRLGRSLPMLLQVMEHLLAHRCTVVTVGDGRVMLPNRTMTLFVNYLREIVEIESRMKACRSLDVVHTKREEGVTLGRPKGAKRAASKTVLHGKTDRLVELYQNGHTLVEIAEELGVSRGTVSNYLKAEGLFHAYRK